MVKVLLVEDDPSTAFIQTSLLEKLGLTVHVVGRGDEAVDQMRSLRPDAVILDLILPGKMGVDILFEMENDSSLKEIAIVACSGNVDEQDEVFRRFRETFRSLRKEEPVVVNKIPHGRTENQRELPDALAFVLEKKGISPPPSLKAWRQS